MQAVPLTELSDRAREVFRAVVEAYLATGVPVGSRTLARHGGFGLSAASLRNVMQDLEEMGLLAAPHVSAGRQPTELGLRLFVDGMMQASEPGADDRAAIDSELGSAGGASVEALLDRTTSLLSGLSACAGIVLAPKADMVLRQVSFVPLSPARALVVLVGSDGGVENRMLDLPPGLPATVLVEAENYVNARLCGLSLPQAVERLRSEIDSERALLDRLAQDIVERGLGVWTRDGAARPILIVRGSAHLLDAAADDLDRVRALIADLDGKEDLLRVLDMARAADALKIFIGSENKLFSLSGSSVIAAPYHGTGDRVVGVIGVIGPTRLNYARVVPMVDYTAKALGRLIS